MKFWDEELEEEPIYGDAEFRGVTIDPLEQIDGPAANDVIGDFDYLDFLALQCTDEGEVHVCKPN